MVNVEDLVPAHMSASFTSYLSVYLPLEGLDEIVWRPYYSDRIGKGFQGVVVFCCFFFFPIIGFFCP